MTTLKQLTDQVVEDKKVQKALTSYVEGGRDLLCVTIFAGKSVLSSSPEIAQRLEKKPELMAALMELFEDKSLVTTNRSINRSHADSSTSTENSRLLLIQLHENGQI